MAITTLEGLQSALREALRPIEEHRDFALLNYPDHPNIGDHLIWLGTLQHLSRIGARLRHAASAAGFSPERLNREAERLPILMAGGGNLGDIWPQEEQFRQSIIEFYHDRPIYVLPQTIGFLDLDKARAAAAIYNAHPNLTLFLRDDYSLEFARKWFSGCQLLLAPDLAFALHPLPRLPRPPKRQTGTLFHCRVDKEYRELALPAIEGLVKEEWTSYGGLRLDLGRRLSRLAWMKLYPAADEAHAGGELNRRSWGMLHDGIYQFERYPHLITNRLHGHILALLLGIPHIVLPGNYHKIESFHRTWTSQLAGCRLVADGRDLAYCGIP